MRGREPFTEWRECERDGVQVSVIRTTYPEDRGGFNVEIVSALFAAFPVDPGVHLREASGESPLRGNRDL